MSRSRLLFLLLPGLGAATPLRGAPVVIAGSDCSRPAFSGTTDSSGGFSFPGVDKTHHVTWMIPMFDRVAPGYVLCVSSGDTLLPAYHVAGRMEGPWPRDSVACVRWTWRDQPRTSCSGNAERALASGGRWIEGEATGWYQVILTREDTTPPGRGRLGRRWQGPPRPQNRSLVVVQCLEQSDAARPAMVRWAVTQQLDKDVEAAGEVTLEERYNRWCATVNTVRSVRRLYWTSDKREVVTFTLGPPGQAHPVPEC